MPTSRLQRSLSRIADRRPDPLTSVVLTIPVFLTYHLGVLLIDFRNGVDLVTDLTFRLLEASIPSYVGLTLLLSAGLLGVVWLQRRRGHVRPMDLGGIVTEGCLWAAFMVVSVGWAAAQLTSVAELGTAAGGSHLGPLASGAIARMGPVDRIVMAAGAGFHEELVFRVCLLSGGARLLQRARGQGPALAWSLSAIASSLIFSAVHHIGPMGDPLVFDVFAFRALAGMYLAGVYLLRGFAVAVYTHTLYDIFVFFVFS